MKIDCRHTVRASRTQAPGSTGDTPTSARSERGFAVLVVMILLAIIASLAVGNNVALRHLHQDLRLIEERQQRRHVPNRATNAPAPSATATLPSGEQGAALSASASLK